MACAEQRSEQGEPNLESRGGTPTPPPYPTPTPHLPSPLVRRTDAQIIALETEVLKRRLVGHAFRDIAEDLGVSVGYAHERYKRALDRHVQAPAHELRQVEAERLDIALTRAMQIVTQSPNELRAVEAIDKVARLAEVRARILGFMQPTKIEAEVEVTSARSDIDDSIRDLLAKAHARFEPEPPPSVSSETEGDDDDDDVVDAEIVEDVEPLVGRTHEAEDEGGVGGVSRLA